MNLLGRAAGLLLTAILGAGPAQGEIPSAVMAELAQPSVTDAESAERASGSLFSWGGIPGTAAVPETEVRPLTPALSSEHLAPKERWSFGDVERPLGFSQRGLTESTWYTRVDYFHWDERLDGQELLNEDGALATLGYVHRGGIERFRFELFGGTVDYDGAVQYLDGRLEPLKSTTDYLGMRAEYDLLWEPDWWPRGAFSVGLGDRTWVRVLPDTFSSSGKPVWGYHETWCTVYPYLGLETRRVRPSDVEWFASGRIGFTPLTFQFVSLDDVVLHPRTGLTGQLEFGLRGQTFHLSLFSEAMSWAESGIVRGVLQPASQMATVGLKMGFSF